MSIRDAVVETCEHWRIMPQLAEPVIKELYNEHKPLPRGFAIPMSGNNSDWCACMVSEALTQAYLTAGKENPYREVSAQYLFEKLNKDYGSETVGEFVRVGDIIFYDWNNDGGQNHTGIVVDLVELSGKVIGAKVCEGNVNDRMYLRTITFGLKVNGCYPVYIPIVYPDEIPEPPDSLNETLKQILNYCKAIEKLIENL